MPGTLLDRRSDDSVIPVPPDDTRICGWCVGGRDAFLSHPAKTLLFNLNVVCMWARVPAVHVNVGVMLAIRLHSRLLKRAAGCCRFLAEGLTESIQTENGRRYG